MKTFNYSAAFAISILMGLIPASSIYYLWHWAMDQVPKTNEWAGLIKVGITIAMAPSGVAIGVWGGLMAMSLSASLFSWLLDEPRSKS